MKKFLKIALLGLLILIGILVVLPVFLPQSAHVERSIRIEKSPAEVFAVVSDFSQSPKWDPWATADPTVVTESSDTPGVGSTYQWQGEEAGKGTSKMVAAEAPKHVKVEIHMLEPMDDYFTSEWQLAADGEGTLATWSYDQKMSYMQRYIGLCMDAILGESFEQGLSNLKAYVEGK